MALIDIYEWLTGSQTEFEDTNIDYDTQDLATRFWQDLNGSCQFSLIAMIAIVLLVAIIYFIPYNNAPGRHYRMTHWLLFMLIAIVLSFVVTAVFGYCFTKPTIHGATALVWLVAFGNLIYSCGLFLIISSIWWLFLPTNAFRPFYLNSVK